MFHALLEAVRAEVSGERALESVRAISRYHRVQASPGYDAAAQWLCDRLESYGLAVEVEKVTADGRTRVLGQLMPEGWACERALATVVEGTTRKRLCDYDAEKLSLILRSDSARGRHRVMLLDDGTEAAHYDGIDVKGAVVLTRGAVQRVHQLAVVERGAAGLLFDGRRLVPPVRDRFDDPDALTYTSFWWNGDEPRGWGFVVSPRRGHQLRERLRSGAALELEVEVVARRFATEIPLVSASIPGEQPSEVLVVAHLCHPQPSANDNASGVAAALETARALATLRTGSRLRAPNGKSVALRHGVRWLWIPEFTGTFAWLGQDAGRAARLVAAINLDMVGEDQHQCGSTLLIEHPPCFAASYAEELLARIRAQAVEWVPSYSGPGHYSMTRMAEVPFGGGSDHAVLVDPMMGVPCPMMIQWPDRYYHSSHDTPDKTDPRSLALAARCAATYAAFLATARSPEIAWLLGAVERGAKRRVLQALDHPQAAHALERERVRAPAAVASLSGLGLDARMLDDAQHRITEFMACESGAALGEPAPGPVRRGEAQDQLAPNAGAKRPRRCLHAALHLHWHLMEGYAGLSSAQREALRELESRTPESQLIFELAWFACDGRRTIDDIARLVHLETGLHVSKAIAEFFEWTARLGHSAWNEADQ